MKDSKDLFESIREELNVTPSASFDARLRARLDAERPVPSVRWPWLAAAAASAVIVAAAASYVSRPASVMPQGPHETAAQATEPAFVMAPPPAHATITARSQNSAPRPTKTPTDPTKTSVDPKEFDPFTDVLVDPAEQRGFVMLVTHRDDESVPLNSRSLSIEEPVQVLALSAPEPLDMPLLDIRNQAGTSDGQMR